MFTPLQSLSEGLRSKKVIPVIGAGVSYAAAGIPGWQGLIESGIKFCEDRGVDSRKISSAKKYLQKKELIKAASLVSKLLEAPGGAFPMWLQDFFEAYRDITSFDLLISIKKLMAPFALTTNYDTLLTESGGHFSYKTRYDWKNPDAILNEIAQKSEFLLHLHGVYKNPESVIFCGADYKQLIASPSYKFILNRLWSENHLLFIGCSVDGVLDPDFISTIELFHKLFPFSTSKHYLLVNSREKIDRLDFLNKYHIEVLPYGEKYEDLPRYIDDLNPHYTEATRRIDEELKNTREIFNDHTNKNRKYLLGINENLTELLKAEGSWIEPDNLISLKQSLIDKNLSNLNKREAFDLHKQILLDFIEIEDLEAQVKLEGEHSFNSAALSNEKFVVMGARSYAAIIGLPKEMLDDINHFNYRIIHPIFFNGMAKSFINEMYDSLKQYGERFYEEYREERYFFENFGRMMRSLLQVLKLSSSELYPEISKATFNPQLPIEVFATATTEAIEIRDKNDIYRVHATLPIHGAEIKELLLLRFGIKILIVGCTSAEAFYWDPTKDLNSTLFYKAEGQNFITEMVGNAFKNQIQVFLKTSKGLLKFMDFINVSSHKINNIFDLQTLTSCGSLLGIECSDNWCSKPSIVQITDQGRTEVLISYYEILEIIIGLPGLNVALTDIVLKDKPAKSSISLLSMVVHNCYLKTIGTLTNSQIVLRVKLDFSPYGSFNATVLLFFSFADGLFKQIGFQIIPLKLSLAFDHISYKTNRHLIVGYLDQGKEIDLVEMFEEIKYSKLTSGKSIKGYLNPEQFSGDIYDIQELGDENCLINQNGRRLILLNLNTADVRSFEFDSKNRLKKIRV
ncbi:SIR2 family protein [Pedobacter sp.]|jgi:hypothetical protein|uniref:SIR2 family NAD-dependent protein deacylase n=1 Tax=Pedobacter sp. TaxID=1411316 RepID=UPI002CECC34A|nr:SIR2 family protein [Pedobacter sp.]HWW37908.1 SIR2 family protein [Pedobacter sp.]